MSNEWNKFRNPFQPPNCLGLVLQQLGLAKDGNHNTRALEYPERCSIVPNPDEANAAAYVVFSKTDRERFLDYSARIEHVVALNPHQPNQIINRIQPGADIKTDHSLLDAFSDAQGFDLGGEIVYLD